MRKALSLVITMVLVTAFAVSVARAEVPTNMNVQGRLTDAAGDPASPGFKNFTFKIFNQEVGGTEVWPAGPGETQLLTTDADGLWNAAVGAVVPLTAVVFQDTTRWLQVTVDDGVDPPETLPRIKLNTSAYTYRAASAQDADAVGGLTPANLNDAYVNETGDGMTGPLDVVGGHILNSTQNPNSGDPSIAADNRSDGYSDGLNEGSGTWGISADAAADNAGFNVGTGSSAQGNATSNYGVYGKAAGSDNTSTNYGIYGDAAGGARNFAGYFSGPVTVSASASDTSVILPGDAISDVEILNEPGVGHAYTNGPQPVDGAPTALESVSITAPTDGYVLVFATFTGRVTSHTVGTREGYRYSISKSSTSLDYDNWGAWSVPAAQPSFSSSDDGYTGAHTLHAADVVAAGSHTYYMTFDRFTGAAILNVYDIHMSAIFVPTVYGTLEDVLAKPQVGQDDPSRSDGGDAVPNVEIVRLEDHNAAIEAELAALRADLDRLKSQMQISGGDGNAVPGDE